MQDPEMIVNGAAVRVSAGAPFYMDVLHGISGKICVFTESEENDEQ